MAKGNKAGDDVIEEVDIIGAGGAGGDNPPMFENADDGLIINLEGVKAQTFEPLPVGTYNIIIEEVVFGFSKSSNKPMWNAKLAVTDEGEYQNRKLFTFLSWSEKAIGGSKAALQTFAPELAETQLRVNDPELLASLAGRKARVRVKMDKYQGEDVNRVGRWMIPEDAGGDAGAFIE
jgi:hypothetical protein